MNEFLLALAISAFIVGLFLVGFLVSVIANIVRNKVRKNIEIRREKINWKDLTRGKF